MSEQYILWEKTR